MFINELQRQRYRRRIRALGFDPDDMPIKVEPHDAADAERAQRVADFLNWKLVVDIERQLNAHEREAAK